MDMLHSDKTRTHVEFAIKRDAKFVASLSESSDGLDTLEIEHLVPHHPPATVHTPTSVTWSQNLQAPDHHK